MSIDIRSELLALRAEFKQLAADAPFTPDAQWSERSDGYQEWSMKGFSSQWGLFRGLAARASLANGGKANWQEWLSVLADEHGLTNTHTGFDSENGIKYFGGWLTNPARLSVLTIDRLLVAIPPAEVMPPAGDNPKPKQKRRNIDWWLEKLTEYESAWADDASLTEAAFARTIGEKPNTVSAMFRKARAKLEERKAQQKRMREQRT